MWLAAQGARRGVHRGPKFDNLSDVIEAAVSGQGIALARSLLVQDALAAGELGAVASGRRPRQSTPSIWSGANARAPRAGAGIGDWLVGELPEIN